MGAAPVVIILVSLVFPILLLLAAIAFDVVVLLWAVVRVGSDRIGPRIGGHLHIGRWHRLAQ